MTITLPTFVPVTTAPKGETYDPAKSEAAVLIAVHNMTAR